MKIKRKIIALPALAVLFFATSVQARENVTNGHRESSANNRESTQEQVASACTPASAKTDMDINNVRTTIMTGGDMWWDLTSAKYEVPKGGGAHSIFAGALWVGGLDAGGQLKVAAMTYRQTGNDFWPGPLDTTSVSVEGTTCTAFDRHWKIKRSDVEDFYSYTQGTGPSGYTVPLVIQTWPGNGDASLGQGHYLAPFVDVDGDGFYNWTVGDYPAYDLTGSLGCTKFQLFGDQSLWWVFNDKGNIHSETGAAAIGLEVQAQAFAFSTNDEINNMTFYQYKIINRSTVSLNHTYFGQWTDADLGYYLDDFVGCDVKRGLGYTYNGDQNDGSGPNAALGTYGANPPAIGMDFFEGPIADANDGIDNDRDGVTDEPGEQIIMSKFVYYNNDFSVIGNPENATHYYNYLSGFWKDGTPFEYGENAHNTTSGMPCDYMFPGDSDPTGFGTNMQPQPLWSEESVPDPPGDRRMLQSAGAFTLDPGAVNYITVGAVWARAAAGGPSASVALMRATDDKAQRLFDNCFRTLDGPDAPDVTVQELDKELVLYLTNKPLSNNYLERYHAIDPSIVYSSIIDTTGNHNLDTAFDFQGYQIFQLRDAQVTTADLYDLNKARLVAECDIKDGVTNLVNREFDQALNADVPKDMTITANDEGVTHSFDITQDAFASGDSRLINQKTYYFMAITYAYNQYLPYADVSFDPHNPRAPSNIGQKKPYLAGRRNVKIYSAIPHIPSPEAGGTNQQSTYGSGPKLTRIEGSGSGDNVLDFTEATENAIVAAQPVVFNSSDPTNNAWFGSARVDQVQYQNGRGPVNIKVIDPLNVPEGQFTIQIVSNPNSAYVVKDTARWILKQVSPQTRSWSSDTTVNIASIYANEQIIPELGMSVVFSQVQTPGQGNNPLRNSYLESSMTFADPTKDWLSGVVDDDSRSESNWIRGGSDRASANPGDPCNNAYDDRFSGTNAVDPDGDYEKVVNGLWGPYRLASDIFSTTSGCLAAAPVFYPASPVLVQNKFDNVSSINVVLTNDRSKWTRVPVFEVGPNASTNSGLTPAWNLRNSPSVDWYGKTAAQGGITGGGVGACDFVNTTGMSYFPGYAVNLETGERLNMAFGENSSLVAENGRDMLWNPTAHERSTFFDPLFGGQHYIYVFGHNGNSRYTTGSTWPNGLLNELKQVPAYDCGRMIMKVMTAIPSVVTNERSKMWFDAMWVSIPELSSDFATWHFDYAASPLPTDVKIRIRVAKPYKRALTAVTPLGPSQWTQYDTVFAAQNGNNPMYSFDTYDLKTTTNSNAAAVSALDLINVVPNPYYAYSAYEKNQLDNRVKFTNLPEKCSIQIYTVSGTLIRKFTKDSPQTYFDWDLKNQAGIPIASGLYIIHIDVEGVGEKVLKWFGVLRPIDLDAY